MDEDAVCEEVAVLSDVEIVDGLESAFPDPDALHEVGRGPHGTLWVLDPEFVARAEIPRLYVPLAFDVEGMLAGTPDGPAGAGNNLVDIGGPRFPRRPDPSPLTRL